MIEARFCIVTPLFMGGANSENPELRVPGIKGALRFWWRALAWSWCKGDLSKIRDLEGRIFGSTEQGQSRVIMELARERAKPANESFFEKKQGLMYLGYGPIDKGKLTREYLEDPVDATLRIRIRPESGDGNESVIADRISKALIAMGLFGGLGARSRRGFGSFNLTELNVNGEKKISCPTGKEQLEKEIKGLLEGLDLYKGMPEYTAFSSNTEVYIYKNNKKDPLDLLDDVGRRMQEYRLGSRKNVKGRGSSSGFREDTNLAKYALKNTVNKHPRRLFFGLPHNYFFKNLGQSLEVKGENHDRRASPLLIHVQKLNGEYAAVAALLPARFLPVEEKIVLAPMKTDGKQIGVKSRVPLDSAEAERLEVIRKFLESNFEKVYPDEREQ